MAFCGRRSGPITPICNTKRLTVQKNICTKFHKDISTLLKLQLARSDGRTDSHPDFNSSLHPDHSNMLREYKKLIINKLTLQHTHETKYVLESLKLKIFERRVTTYLKRNFIILSYYCNSFVIVLGTKYFLIIWWFKMKEKVRKWPPH